MRLDSLRRSSNVEVRGRARGGGRMVAGGLGGGGLLIVLLIGLALGRSPGEILGEMSGVDPESETETPIATDISPEEARAQDFVAKVLGTTEDAWHEALPKLAGPGAQ